ncbi:MAG: dihydroorotate dehydrogenase electron transfer subunit [Bacteroidetes bacterium]|nr:dihydroorotate dehydrogenase electron transfer subunit [Bacteroidota bacterium]
MYIEKAKVESIEKTNEQTFLLKLFSPSIASSAEPGQFCNVKVSERTDPLLRRPFSICNVEGESIYFLFDIHGEGTKLLSRKKLGDEIEILGPLGKGFVYDGDYEIAVIVAGGLGTAPFPFLINRLSKDKKVAAFVGARSKNLVLQHGLKNILVATDDGSAGFHGTVVDLLKKEIFSIAKNKFRIFGCGPNPMLKALQKYTVENNFNCQISVEGAMACGFGICQGCPIEASDGESYLLVCKDGPVFDAKKVNL